MSLVIAAELQRYQSIRLAQKARQLFPIKGGSEAFDRHLPIGIVGGSLNGPAGGMNSLLLIRYVDCGLSHAKVTIFIILEPWCTSGLGHH